MTIFGSNAIASNTTTSRTIWQTNLFLCIRRITSITRTNTIRSTNTIQTTDWTSWNAISMWISYVSFVTYTNVWCCTVTMIAIIIAYWFASKRMMWLYFPTRTTYLDFAVTWPCLKSNQRIKRLKNCKFFCRITIKNSN